MRVLAVSGSLRRDSHNTKLLRAAEELAPEGFEFEFYEELESLPPYNEDRDGDEAPLGAASAAPSTQPQRKPRSSGAGVSGLAGSPAQGPDRLKGVGATSLGASGWNREARYWF